MATKAPSMCRALDDALRSAQLEPSDRAAVVLAKHYAARLDADPDAIVKIGHMILPVLTALGMTPAARQALAKGASAGAPTSSPLDELRAKRATRRDRASAVDSAAPGAHS